MSRDTDRQVNETQNQVMSELIREIKSLRDEVSGLRNELQEVRRIEDKTEVAEKSNKKTTLVAAFSLIASCIRLV